MFVEKRDIRHAEFDAAAVVAQPEHGAPQLEARILAQFAVDRLLDGGHQEIHGDGALVESDVKRDCGNEQQAGEGAKTVGCEFERAPGRLAQQRCC